MALKESNWVILKDNDVAEEHLDSRLMYLYRLPFVCFIYLNIAISRLQILKNNTFSHIFILILSYSLSFFI